MIQQRLRTALRDAMSARDKVAVSALRSALAALDNATAVPSGTHPGPGSAHVAGAAPGVGATEAPRRVLTDADAETIVRTEIADRLAAASTYGPGPAADRLHAEAAHLATFLPPA